MIDKLLTYPTILPFIFVFDNTKNPLTENHLIVIKKLLNSKISRLRLIVLMDKDENLRSQILENGIEITINPLEDISA